MVGRKHDGGHFPRTVFTIGENAFIPQSRFYYPEKGENSGPMENGGKTLIISNGKFVDCGVARVETIPLES